MAATWSVVDGGRSVRGVMAGTDTRPTGVGDGVSLDSVAGFTVAVQTASGTFSAQDASTGKLAGYVYDPAWGFWARAPGLDIDIPAEAEGESGFADTGWSVSAPRSRIAHIADGISVGVVVTYGCSTLFGHRT